MTKSKSPAAVHYSTSRAAKHSAVIPRETNQPTDSSVVKRPREKSEGAHARRDKLRSFSYIIVSGIIFCTLLGVQTSQVNSPKIASKPIKRTPARQLPVTQTPPSNTTLVSLNSPLICPQGVVLNTVAHEDDDILFMNPAIQEDIAAGMCIRTVFVTAGDDGQDASYWHERERGPDAAYAAMFGVADDWTAMQATINSHQVTIHSLATTPRVSLVFLQLPDGGIEGQGFSSTGFESLLKLRSGQISAMRTVAGQR